MIFPVIHSPSAPLSMPPRALLLGGADAVAAATAALPPGTRLEAGRWRGSGTAPTAPAAPDQPAALATILVDALANAEGNRALLGSQRFCHRACREMVVWLFFRNPLPGRCGLLVSTAI